MRLDHYALRVPNKAKATHYLTMLLGYSLADEFIIKFKSRFDELDDYEKFSWMEDNYQKLPLEHDEEKGEATNAKNTDTNQFLAFDDRVKVSQGSANCSAMVPSERTNLSHPLMVNWRELGTHEVVQYHSAPEIFVSEGTPGSIVDLWVKERAGLGGIHHIAYQLDSVEALNDKIREWKSKGIQFSSDSPIQCPDDQMWQIFSKPIDSLGGITYELIHRGEKGFCEGNVEKLMKSTKRDNQ